MPVAALASGFGAGFSPFAPGTAGSLVGVALYALVHDWHWSLYIALTLFITTAGIPICGRAEKIFGEKDSRKIVIDEIAGQLIALFAVPFSIFEVTAAFLLFRLFDIFKPFPKIEELRGGFGVMMDDVAAGFIALFALHGFLFLFR